MPLIEIFMMSRQKLKISTGCKSSDRKKFKAIKL